MHSEPTGHGAHATVSFTGSRCPKWRRRRPSANSLGTACMLLPARTGRPKGCRSSAGSCLPCRRRKRIQRDKPRTPPVSGQNVPAAEPRGQYVPIVQGEGRDVAEGHSDPAGQAPTQTGLSCVFISESVPQVPGGHANG
eukprot:scaffold14485_cov67-Phaeocystis_antarctica.AAC.7